MAQGDQVRTRVGDSRQTGFRDEPNVTSVEKGCELLDVGGTAVFVQLVELQLLDMAFKAVGGKETPCGAGLLNDEDLESAGSAEDLCGEYAVQWTVSQWGGNEI